MSPARASSRPPGQASGQLTDAAESPAHRRQWRAGARAQQARCRPWSPSERGSDPAAHGWHLGSEDTAEVSWLQSHLTAPLSDFRGPLNGARPRLMFLSLLLPVSQPARWRLGPGSRCQAGLSAPSDPGLPEHQPSWEEVGLSRGESQVHAIWSLTAGPGCQAHSGLAPNGRATEDGPRGALAHHQ